MTLTEFLLARIAEDEEIAERAGSHNGGATFAKDNYGCLLVQPARVLAECEKNRRIVALGENIPADNDDHWFDLDDQVAGRYRAIKDILLLLALPYAGHPDFREEWGA